MVAYTSFFRIGRLIPPLFFGNDFSVDRAVLAFVDSNLLFVRFPILLFIAKPFFTMRRFPPLVISQHIGALLFFLALPCRARTRLAPVMQAVFTLLVSGKIFGCRREALPTIPALFLVGITSTIPVRGVI